LLRHLAYKGFVFWNGSRSSDSSGRGIADPDVEPLQGAPPAAVNLSAEDDDDVALARLRELEEAELLALVEEEAQASALAAVFAAKEQRKAARDTLTAAHEARIKALRELISDSKRARTSLPRHLPLLAESMAARMDKGVSLAPQPYLFGLSDLNLQPLHETWSAPSRLWAVASPSW
jgi:hypothetical protein